MEPKPPQWPHSCRSDTRLQGDKSVIELCGPSRPEGVASEFAGGTFRSLLSRCSGSFSCLLSCSLRLFALLGATRFCFLGSALLGFRFLSFLFQPFLPLPPLPYAEMSAIDTASASSIHPFIHFRACAGSFDHMPGSTGRRLPSSGLLETWTHKH